MTNKMTKRDYYKMAIAETNNEELKAFFAHELELVENKAKRNAEATRKPTKNQIANETLKNDILGYIATKPNATIADIKNEFDLSSQKITPLVNALATDGKLTKVVEKRVAYYSLA